MRGTECGQFPPTRQHAYHEYCYMQSPQNAVTPYVVTTCMPNIGTFTHHKSQSVNRLNKESAMAEAVGMDVVNTYYYGS